jgi:Lipase (class 3)
MQTPRPEQTDDLRRFEGIPATLNCYPGFGAQRAHELATLIGSAYEQFKQQGQGTWMIPKGYKLIKELKHNKGSRFFGLVNQSDRLFGYVALKEKEREVFIIIRGTRTTYEWFNNTATSYEVYTTERGNKWGITTEGFYSIYTDLRTEISEALKSFKGQFDHIFVSGHSLGGALATLAIPDLFDWSILAPAKIDVYTFASPRCVDRPFAKKLNDSKVRHWRIANTEDIVPTLPGATANIFSPEKSAEPEEIGGNFIDKIRMKAKGNFILKIYKKLKADGMRTLEHTGTPIYFTVGTNSIQDNHNLEIVYMTGIGEQPAVLPK